ncbi:helicase HerA-like C-terminal domain-containing protein [Noviherbaspirillum autotrophicum]|uniref:ATP-binding protein n=1 Tax=Noviherbaspirillum autotrophicum TaxID=709839 RepID=A0A0C2BM89_9BURK|nr:helicase HerA-like C-terminal domain-containing protein [Noviherbaspirillum autotrophicum]KIF81119.1 ATP-binding protein [Noviherbaspirillum autotrophicum]
MSNPLLIAKNQTRELELLPNLANRHGCITGATGTGKTVTLQVLAQALSDIGVPVFMADVKGDLSGLAKPGSATPRIRERLDLLKLEEPAWAGCPVTFWDVFGEQGHPVRATISDLGPLLLSRMLNLNEVQQGVLQLVFKVADDHGLLLLDMKDLRAMLQHVAEHASELQTEYGNISAASIGAIQRGLIAIEEQGGDRFFGEPMLNIDDFMQTDGNGRGMINILAADKLLNSPRLYAIFLLWMLAELFERLPEVGDVDKPKLVFFFDEAHLLFDEAPKALLQKIEQVVRLIRSKGVGVYFVTQNPLDIPDTVLGQLGNRVQHALRAYTPRDQKAVQAAAETFRPNPQLDTAQVITELGVGEALISFLDDKGRPNIVERAYVVPPASQIGPVSAAERSEIIANSMIAGVYEKVVDRDSAYEKLKGRVVAQAQTRDAAPASKPAGTVQNQNAPQESGPSIGASVRDMMGGLFGGSGVGRRKDTMVEAMVKSAARSIGSQVGRELIRGVLGSLLKK